MTAVKSDSSSGSTTQCHSEGCLEARLAQEGGTEPHRASELAARLADHPSQECAILQLVQVNNEPHKSEPLSPEPLSPDSRNLAPRNSKPSGPVSRGTVCQGPMPHGSKPHEPVLQNSEPQKTAPQEIGLQKAELQKAKLQKTELQKTDPHKTVSSKAPAQSYSMMDLPIRTLSPATRCVIFPSAGLADSLPTQQKPHGNSNIPEDVFIVCQSSEAAWYNFTSEHLSFQLFYDPASDNLVFVNHTPLRLSLDALKPGNIKHPGIHRLCFPRQRLELSPGVWRVSDTDKSRTALCDFLLLKRTYSIEVKDATEAGSKRKISGPSVQLKKRQLEENRSLILVNPTPVVSSSSPSAIEGIRAIRTLAPYSILKQRRHHRTNSITERIGRRSTDRHEGWKSATRGATWNDDVGQAAER